MPVMDEFKEERNSIREQPLSKRLEYFWDYYKWYVIGGIFALVLLCNFIHHMMGKKEYALFGIVVEGSVIGDEEGFLDDFCTYAGIDPDDYEVVMNSGFYSTQLNNEGLNTSQFILTHLSGRKLDIALMDMDSYARYGDDGFFLDLRLLLDEELYEVLEEEGRVYYANSTPVGIKIRGIKRLEEVYYFSDDDACLGVFANTKKSETAARFIEFLCSD